MTLTYPGWSGLRVVATVCRTRTGQDQPTCAVMTKWTLFIAMSHVTFGMPHLYKGTWKRCRSHAACERNPL